ncbi:MAG: hypothetical protein M0P69_11405 [Bacteroidales bacterium]|nr:hypothetical protein [Bacteroidales bacterium]
MLSDIQKLIITNNLIELTRARTEMKITVDVAEFFKSGMAEAVVIDVDGQKSLTNLSYAGDWLKIEIDNFGTISQFFPHEMYRNVMKDLNKGREFDIAYRKHLVKDYSQDHFNTIVPYEVSTKTRDKAETIIRRHSTGKLNKPTGIILDYKLIIIKGDSSFVYDL